MSQDTKKRALITGITGQDGSYLAELLLIKGYDVHGIIRRSSSFNTSRLDKIYQDPHDRSHLHLHYGDITDASRLSELIQKIQPNEVYNLAAMSHVKVSFDEPIYAVNADAIGVINILEAIRHYAPSARFLQASSSEMFR